MKEPKDIAREQMRKMRSTLNPAVRFDRVALVREAAAGKKVLDIGCVNHQLDTASRKDWLHGHIREVAREVTGLDYEEEAIEDMRKQGYRVVAADATHFDLNEQFDLVVAGDIIEHVTNAGGLLQSVKRHLAPGGRLLITTPNANTLNYFMQNLIYGYEVDGYDHTTFYTPLTLCNLLERCGYVPEQLIYLQPDTVHHHGKWLDRVLVRMFRLIQCVLVRLRPQMARQIGVIARPCLGDCNTKTPHDLVSWESDVEESGGGVR